MGHAPVGWTVLLLPGGAGWCGWPAAPHCMSKGRVYPLLLMLVHGGKCTPYTYCKVGRRMGIKHPPCFWPSQMLAVLNTDMAALPKNCFPAVAPQKWGCLNQLLLHLLLHCWRPFSDACCMSLLQTAQVYTAPFPPPTHRCACTRVWRTASAARSSFSLCSWPSRSACGHGAHGFVCMGAWGLSICHAWGTWDVSICHAWAHGI